MENSRFEFRAWDKANKRMIVAMNKEKLNMSVFTGDRILEYVAMQYTGLKDKNLVKIFEGDIINHKYSVFRGSSRSEKTFIGVLEWYENDTLYILKNKKQNKIHFHSVSEDCIEVIGNIYEHSYLLDNN